MKKRLLLTVFAVIFACCLIGIIGCGKNENSIVPEPVPKPKEETIVLKDPALSDITVYSSYKPCGFYVGKGTVSELKINGTVVAKELYIVCNGYLVFSAESWKDAGFADGENELTFGFSDYGEKKITVTTSEAEKAVPGDALTEKEYFSVWQFTDSGNAVISYDEANSALKLSRLTSNDSENALSSVSNVLYVNSEFIGQIGQSGACCVSFDLKTQRSASSDKTIKIKIYATETLGILSGDCDKYEFEADGNYHDVVIDVDKFNSANANAKYFAMVIGGRSGDEIFIKDWKIDTVETLNIYKAGKLIPDYGFFEENVSNWKSANTEGVVIEWSDAENAMGVRNKGSIDYGLDRRYNVIYADNGFMRLAETVGYKTMSFNVKGDQNFVDSLTDTNSKGIRIYSKTKAGADDGRIGDGKATGVKVYKDFGTGKPDKAFRIDIDIKSFLDLNRDAPYIGMVCSVMAGGVVYFNNLSFSKESVSPPEEDSPDKSVFSEKKRTSL